MNPPSSQWPSERLDRQRLPGRRLPSFLAADPVEVEVMNFPFSGGFSSLQFRGCWDRSECSGAGSRQNSDAKECVVLSLMTRGMKDLDGEVPSTAAGVDVLTGDPITIVIRAITVLLLLIGCGNATELLRDKHTETTYTFKSDSKDIAPRISQREAILKADEWATGFYGDYLLRPVECRFRTKPIGHWLVTFQKAETGQEFYAVILPDGGIVVPSIQRGL
jgi:hypothetical protein